MGQNANTRVAIVGGARTPFAKAGTAFKKHSPLALSVYALNGLLDKLDLDPDKVDELIHGIVVLDPRNPHLAKELVFSSKLPGKVAIEPDDGLLMGPGVAVPRVLKKAGLKLDDIDLIEMHEAFGGQVACNIKAWEQGWKEPAIGTVDRSKLNQLGGSIAIGHPFAATGIRMATTLANEMKRQKARYGLISICAAGAQASAMILERN